MNIIRFLRPALLGAVLMVPVCAPLALQAEDWKSRTYHDKKNNDDHQWNGNEDQAYHMYAKDNPRKEKDFSKQSDNDQQAYWAWRHDHSDALLKINIR